VCPQTALAKNGLEQAVLSAVESAQHVVVDGHTTDATIVGKHPRLWLDQLRGEDAVDGAEQCVAAHQVQIPAELFDTVNLATTFDSTAT